MGWLLIEKVHKEEVCPMPKRIKDFVYDSAVAITPLPRPIGLGHITGGCSHPSGYL